MMSADVEDLVILNGKTKFESFGVSQCLEGMLNHQRHNGVQLDGLRRLTDLCKREKNSLYLILTDKWMRSLILPITERFQGDNRLQSLLFCVIGTAIRCTNVEQRSQETAIFSDWHIYSHAATQIIVNLSESTAVSAYGFYMICSILSLSRATIDKEEVATCVHRILHAHWKRDNWAVLNGLLIVKDIKDDLSEALSQQLKDTIRVHHPDFEWEQLDRLIVHYEGLL